MFYRFLLFLILSIPFGVTCFTDDSDDNYIPIRKKEFPPRDRPKAPSAQRITASVSRGILFVNFAISEGVCQITISDPENTSDYTFDSSTPLILSIGEYHKV